MNENSDLYFASQSTLAGWKLPNNFGRLPSYQNFIIHNIIMLNEPASLQNPHELDWCISVTLFVMGID
jgi:hypothetical protein